MMSDLSGEAVCRPLAAIFERGDAGPHTTRGAVMCFRADNASTLTTSSWEDGAQAVSPDRSGTQRPSLWEQQGEPLALPTECVRCFGLLDGVSADWCVGCLDYLRGGDAA